MTLKVQREIATLKNMLLQMSSLVEDAVRSAVLASQHQDPDLARRVVERDDEVDALEVQIHDLALQTIALQQPMAVDLRFLTSAMEIAGQLERVGDHAVNLADEIINLMGKTGSVCVSSHGLRDMVMIATDMLADSINAFVYGDSDLARDVRNRDMRVDELYAHVFKEELLSMQKGNHEVVPGLYHIIQALNIERIADLATNIAEDVIYLVEGRLVRHDEAAKDAAMDEIATADRKKARPEPLQCLERHAKLVHEALEQSFNAFIAYCDGDDARFQRYLEGTWELEQAADLVKRNVRSHVPRGVIMPIDKFELFQYLNEQDDVANTAEDITDWLTYRRIVIAPPIREGFTRLFRQCLKIAGALSPMITEARAYFKAGGDDVRMQIKQDIRRLRDEETVADGMENQIKKDIFAAHTDTFPVYFLVRLVELVGRTADHAVGAADVMRSMIAR